MFDGYLALDGTEVANAVRAKAYLSHVAPSVYVNSTCCDCEIHEVLGDPVYSSPMQDEAPWFNPYNPASQEFLGVWPLAMEGFEDSTRQVPVVEMMGDGSSFGRPRRAGRDLRVRALLVGESEKGLDYGMTWLRDTLEGSGCAGGDCAGGQVCFFSACPEAACLPDYLDVPLDVDYGPMSTTAARAAAELLWNAPVAPHTLDTPAVPGTNVRWHEHDGAGPMSVETLLTGLLPGASYRVEVVGGTGEGYSGSSTTRVNVEIAGAPSTTGEVDTSDAFGYLTPPEGGETWWVFRANDDTARLVISANSDLILRSVRVVRQAVGQVVANSFPADRPAEYWTWEPRFPTGLRAARIGEEWSFGERVATGASLAGQVYLQNRVLSLEEGGRYRVTLLVRSERTGGIAVPVKLGLLSGTAGTVVTPTAMRNGRMGAWVSFEFTASSGATILKLSNAATIDLNTPDSWLLGVRQYRVERLDVEAELPDPADAYRRYLHDVMLTSGPTVTQTYPHLNVAMREVEWTMHAGTPTPFGETVQVSNTLGAAVIRMPQVECSQGDAVRVNLLNDPSFEYGLTMFTATPSGASLTRETTTTTTPKYGAWAARMALTSSATSKSINITGAPPVSEGSPLTLSGWMKANRRVPATLMLRMMGPNSIVLQEVTRTFTVDVDWTHVEVTAIAPPTVVSVSLMQVTVGDGIATMASGSWVEFDGWLLETSPHAQAFFDGDSPHSSWAGADGVGVSTYRKTTPDLIYDPACPPPPEPPRAPSVPNDCLTTPTAWLRYTMNVPAEATSLSQNVAPTIEVATRELSGRGIRVRVYANPYGYPAEQLDECAFCGEFLVAYMPTYTTLTVDAARRTATMTNVQGTQSVLNLLFGSDGQPMTWPEMSCGIPYIITVDLDAADPPLVNTALAITPAF